MFAPLACFVLCAVHIVSQGVLSLADPWGVGAILRSVKEDMDHTETTTLCDKLRHIRPSVRVEASAFGRRVGPQDRGHWADTHYEDAEFRFASWSDVSGHITGLNEYAVAAIRLVPAIECADPATVESLREHE